MKKLSFLLFSLLAVTLFTACNKSDEPDNRQTVTMTINSRAIDGDDVVFSQGSAKVELNYSDMLIKFTADYKDVDGISHSITTPDMKMSRLSSGSSVYEFVSTSSSQMGSNIGESLAGYIDLATGVMWYTINTGSMQVVCSTHLLYAYTTTTITNPDNGNHGSHQQSAYLFALDSKGQTCIMSISNFIGNLNGAVEASEVQYSDLTLTPTATGYTVTADEVESTNYKGSYTLKDVHFIINNQCQVVAGSFKCKDLDYTVSGTLFPVVSDTLTPVD